MDYEACPVCFSPSQIRVIGDAEAVSCFRCGNFEIDGTAKAMLPDQIDTPIKRSMGSSYMYGAQGMKISRDEIIFLKTVTRPPISQRARRLLSCLAKACPNIGQSMQIHSSSVATILDVIFKHGLGPYDLSRGEPVRSFLQDPHFFLPLLASSYSPGPDELVYILGHYLSDTLGYLGKHGVFNYAITGKGWEFLQESPKAADSSEAFVAMSFGPDLLPFYIQVIEKGVREAGYNPVRLDRTETINRIDDEIIASIRRAKFVVADFTEQKAGAYFEAGYALGLGLKVVWMCSEKDKKNVHFDTRQFNMIFWEDDKFEEAKRMLKNRIEANFGHGAIKADT